MDNVAGNESTTPELETDLVDVTRMPLAELLRSDDTVLDNALRRLLAELAEPQEIIAAHNNVVP